MCFKALCCKGPPPPRPEYDLVCIGLTGSGKTSLLSQLCSESPENIVSTTGFSIKAVPFQNAVLNVKELGDFFFQQPSSYVKQMLIVYYSFCLAEGILLLVVEGGACLYHSSYLLELLIQPGADTIRKYWSRYYQGSQGVIFVLDSASSEDDLETARNELHSALQHPQLCTLPFLILANHQDKPAARSVQEIKKYFELEPLARGKRWILKPCSLDDMEAVKDSFTLLINLLEERELEPSRM
ncbi:ADP-ribosylation factor-like protein 15 isoform X3 [Caretta caretta]|uniref:ADP-ribosylation factor-like protein 15 isoform X2 n=1 Tax=Caretta caretta TaxID=8467 RepID=UPI002094D119|nr:ADP-ribosylation factor-like protein 15 isoform X2 [Caretta caretta]XP_048707784.1 ADP-ribosylation factor-like protein 15 isoform X3 [Caretta caretta]